MIYAIDKNEIIHISTKLKLFKFIIKMVQVCWRHLVKLEHFLVVLKHLFKHTEFDDKVRTGLFIPRRFLE